MWIRADLKRRARGAYKRNIVRCIVVSLILLFFVEGGYSNSSNSSSNSSSDGYSDTMDYSDMDEDIESIMNEATGETLGQAVSLQNKFAQLLLQFMPESVSVLVSGILVGVTGVLVIGLAIFALFLSIFVSNILEVGGCRFFIENSITQAKIGSVLWGFRDGRFKNVFVTQFLRGLYTFLWCLLFIIPGVIKSYEYRMIPYILAEYPDMDRREVFALSRQMMDGQKLNAFLLDLSFIGWAILSSVTFGITGILYSNPYQYATNAELYLVLSDSAFRQDTNNEWNGENTGNEWNGSYGEYQNVENDNESKDGGQEQTDEFND